MNAIDAANEIMELFEKFGNQDYIGEPVSQVEHMCQCAELAEAAGADDELVLGAFLHDIGHLCEFAFPEKKLQHMDQLGIVDHETLGAEFLISKGFSERIAGLVKNHVDAKRYLTAKLPDYYNRLSDASKKTLEFQGGVMTPEEVSEFEMDPGYIDYISVRRWDDEAKVEGKPLPRLFHYKQMMIEHLSKQNY